MKTQKSILKVILGLLTFAGTSAWAAGIGSSGGDNGFVCFKPQAPGTKSIPEQIEERKGTLTPEDMENAVLVKSYDLFEMELPVLDGPTLEILPIQPNEKALEYVERIIKRMEYSVPILAEILRTSQSTFRDNKIRLAPFGVPKQNDGEEAALPDRKNCTEITLAVQDGGGSGGQLTLNQLAFPHITHSELSKAFTWLHEYFYLYARGLGQKTSLNSRRMVQLVTLAEITPRVLIKKMQHHIGSARVNLHIPLNYYFQPQWGLIFGEMDTLTQLILEDVKSYSNLDFAFTPTAIAKRNEKLRGVYNGIIIPKLKGGPFTPEDLEATLKLFPSSVLPLMERTHKCAQVIEEMSTCISFPGGETLPISPGWFYDGKRYWDEATTLLMGRLTSPFDFFLDRPI